MNLPALSAEIKRRIDEQSASEVDKPRWHLGASVIGDECLRRTWYQYRWVAQEEFTGRQKRLFKRGHNEEPQFISLLQSIGFSVRENDPATGKQWRGSYLHGHFGGSCDGIAENNDSCQPQYYLLEFKTHSDKSFKDLAKHGVKKSKPRHFTQMCVYGAMLNLQFAIYLAVNKNDDDIHVEVLELEEETAIKAERTAEAIINAQSPPPRISDNSSFYVCKSCFLRPICHLGEPIAKNCRSCANSKPTDEGNATWRCSKWNAIIPREAAPLGCDSWEPIA